MKNTLLATALFLGGAVFGAHIYRASADTPPGAPPPPGQNMPPPPGPWGMDHHGPFPGGPFPGGMMDRHHDDAFALFARAGLAASNGEARRLIKGGGAKVNDVAVANETQLVGSGDLKDGHIKLTAGKKRHLLIKPE